jgi:hypothetical protein
MPIKYILGFIATDAKNDLGTRYQIYEQGKISIVYEELSAEAAQNYTNLESYQGPLASHPAILHQEKAREIQSRTRYVPMSFGVLTEDIKRLSDAVSDVENKILNDLEEKGDKVELSLTFEIPEIDPNLPDQLKADNPGIAYLRNKYEASASEIKLKNAGRQMINQLTESLKIPLLDMQIEPVILDGRHLVRVHLLLESMHTDKMKKWISVSCFKGGILKQISGPWPPFHFIEIVLKNT